jgi:hypothetical protein
VLIEGTGRWWTGSTFIAVIADVDDKTFKVRYEDGGYKRFPRQAFQALVVSEYHDEDAGVGEPHHEEAFITSTVDGSAVERQLTRRLTSHQDGLRQKDASELRRARERLRLDRIALADAVQSRDFLRAHEVNQRILSMESMLGNDPFKPRPVREVVNESLQKAIGGGLTGAAAMAVQVVSLMWMRTTLYYQYRYGSTTREALHALWRQGGVGRFYQGLLPALLQGPLSRFGDTAANVGIMSFLDAREQTRELPSGVKSLASASAASTWRVFLMPLDTLKTMLQVEGASGLGTLRDKVRAGGPAVLYHGSVGLCSSAFIGHYAWFGVYNALDARLPTFTELLPSMLRNAALGFGASAVADTVTNSLRVVKTFRQTSKEPVTYSQAATAIVKTDGMLGLFGRGLGTRLLANGVQAALFSVTWKYLQKQMAQRQQEQQPAAGK